MKRIGIIAVLFVLMMRIGNRVYADAVMTSTPQLMSVWHNTTLLKGDALLLSPTAPKSHDGEQATLLAKQYLGVPYVWGGASPLGFDCSGLVQYVYKQLGYSVSRTTYTQVNEGTEVSRDGLKQGDLVFFEQGGDIHHVGIYIGNNQYIHAPRTGEVVKISDLSDRNDYYTARRIINDDMKDKETSNDGFNNILSRRDARVLVR